MAKVKVCLDSACVKYIYLEDGRLIHQKKDKCDTNWKPSKNWDEDYNSITRSAKETMYASPDFFKNVEEGKELNFDDDEKPDMRVGEEVFKDKKQEIEALEKRLKELKKKKIESGT